MNHLTELKIADRKLADSIGAIEESIVSFSEITGIPVSFYSPAGALLWEHNNKLKLCSCSRIFMDMTSPCRRTLNSAMNIALGLGEVYIFLCHTGLVNLAYSLTRNDEIIGHFIAGPIAMGTRRDRTIRHIFDKVPSEEMDLPSLLRITNDLRMYSPKETTYLMNMFGNVFNLQAAADRSNAADRQKLQERTETITRLVEMNQDDTFSGAVQPEVTPVLYSGKYDAVSKALAHIHSHYSENLTLAKITEEIHINSSYLSTLFKKEMGETITSYINNLRLETAAKKLRNTNYSITEIAFSCGFDTLSYFTRMFREKFGVTPSQYRR